MALGGRDILKLIVDADAKGAVREFESVGKAAEKNLKKADDGLAKVSSGMQKWGAAAAVSGGIVAAGLFKAADSFVDTALAAGKFSDAVGLSVEDASRWLEVADHIGVSGQAVSSAFRRMDVAIGNNSAGWKNLHVEVAKNVDGSTNLSETFLRVVTALQQIEDPTKRAAAAQALFGKGYAEVAELVGRSAGDLRQKLDEVGAAKVITPEELQKARDFRGAMDDLGDSVAELGIVIGSSVAPLISSFADGVAGIINTVQQLPQPVQDSVGKILGLGTAALIAGGSISFVSGKVIDLVSNVKGLGTSLGKFSPTLGAGFTGLAGGVGIAAAAFIALDSAGNALTHTHERLKAATDELAASMGKDGLAQAAVEFQAEAGTQRSLLGGLIDSVKELGYESTNLLGIQGTSGDAFAQQSNNQRAANEAIKQGLPFFRAYIDGLKASGQNVGDLEAKYQTLISAAANLQTAQDQVASDIEAVGTAATTAGPAIATVGNNMILVGQNSFESRVAGMARALDDQAASAKKAEESLNGLLNAQLALAGSVLGVSAAQRDFNKAVVEADTVSKDAKATSDDKAAAYDRETQAALEVAQATVTYAQKQAEASGKTLNAKQSQDILISTLSSLAGQMNGPSQAAVLGLIANLQRLGQQKPNPTVTVTDNASGPIRNVKDGLDGIRGKSVTVDVNTGPANSALTALRNRLNAAASAGTLVIGTGFRYTFGEGGLVPGNGQAVPAIVHGGEYVLPAGIVSAIKKGQPPGPMSMAGSSALGGRSIIINFSGVVTDPVATGRELKRIIAQAERGGVR